MTIHGNSLIFATLLVATNPIYAAVSYSVDTMGSLEQRSIGSSINNKGEVTGAFLNELGNSGSFQMYGFSYKNGTFQSLGFPENGGSIGHSINNSGQIVGTLFKPQIIGDKFSPNTSYAAIYQNGTMTPITGLGLNGGLSVSINDINDMGTIVGVSYQPNSLYSFCFIYQNGEIKNIGSYMNPTSINNDGQIVGFSYEFTSSGRQDGAFIYQNGQINNLGTLGGRESFAYDINEKGQIIGWATNADEVRRPFIYQDGKMTEIGGLSNLGEATSINNLSDIVGTFYQPDGLNSRAFLYRNGIFSDLNNLVALPDDWVLQYGGDINDNGQIIATGVNSAGIRHAFLLTPAEIPLPNAAWLMFTGLFGFLGLRKRY